MYNEKEERKRPKERRIEHISSQSFLLKTFILAFKNINLQTRLIAYTSTYLFVLQVYKKKINVTKAEVIAEISSKTGIDKADVTASLEAFFSVVKNALAGGNNVYIRGFGSFVVKHRAEKVGRIISQNKSIIIPAHYVPSFKPAKVFVEKVKEAGIQVPNEN